jgi:crotonobetainyl-CoA:carnitine CoA-transferase CaiB-like acyl-CoA transferase
MAELECGLHFMGPQLLDYKTNKRSAIRAGNSSPCAAPHNLYPCKGDEEFCGIAVYTDEEWQGFCDVLGNPEWTKDAKFNTLLARKENEAELDEKVGEWTINYTPDEAMDLLQAAGVPAGARRFMMDMATMDPQLKARQCFIPVEHPVLGTQNVRRPAFVFSKADYDMRPAPLIGDHTEYVFKEILGMTDEQLEELVIEGVIE